ARAGLCRHPRRSAGRAYALALDRRGRQWRARHPRQPSAALRWADRRGTAAAAADRRADPRGAQRPRPGRGRDCGTRARGRDTVAGGRRVMNDFYVKAGDSVSFAKTVGETDIYLFAGITGDFSVNHVNEQYMAQSKYRHRIAHGALLVG